jgi:hypothetical protein
MQDHYRVPRDHWIYLRAQQGSRNRVTVKHQRENTNNMLNIQRTVRSAAGGE